MDLYVVGLNQRTAPVAVRELLACAPAEVAPASSPSGSPGQECVVLSTCNRLEVYCCAAWDAETNLRLVEASLTGRARLDPWALAGHLYFMQGAETVRHLMSVAAGLDSQALGETQVLGQVAQSLGDARLAGSAGPVLTHLFDLAVHAGKRARCETEISRHTISIGHEAVNLVERALGSRPDASILVVGAGETAELALQALRTRGGFHVSCTSRSDVRARVVAERTGCGVLEWQDLSSAMAWADAVITATGAPHPVIHAHDVAPALARREGRRLLFVDIAVPRNVDQEVRDLPGVTVHDIDEIETTLDANLALRRAAIPQVERIIDEETQSMLDWLHGRQVVPVIRGLRDHGRALAAAEADAALRELEGLGPEGEQIVLRMAHRIVSKLLHEPTARLKDHAARGDGYGYAHAVVELFGLGCACETSDLQSAVIATRASRSDDRGA